MATAILFLGWKRANVGMVGQAFDYLMGDGLAYLNGQLGKYFERLEPIGLTPHGGELNGAVILFGERAKLDELRRTDGFEAFSMKMDSLFEGYGVVPGLNWDGIQAMMARRPPSG